METSTSHPQYRKRTIAAALALADTFGLHRDTPLVDLSVLHDTFIPRYGPLRPHALGYSFFPKSGIVTSADPAEIHLDDGLSLFDARLIYAHEIGEHLAGNLSGTFLIPQLDWLYRRGERRAWLGAAGLLIPIALQRQFLTPDIAAVAMVPVWLAQMHRDALGL